MSERESYVPGVGTSSGEEEMRPTLPSAGIEVVPPTLRDSNILETHEHRDAILPGKFEVAPPESDGLHMGKVRESDVGRLLEKQARLDSVGLQKLIDEFKQEETPFVLVTKAEKEAQRRALAVISKETEMLRDTKEVPASPSTWKRMAARGLILLTTIAARSKRSQTRKEIVN